MTVQLRHIVRALPHGAGLRKRHGRTLKPIKPSHKNELWYKVQLLAIVARLRAVATEDLLPELRRLEPLYAKATDSLTRDRDIPRRSLDTTFERMAQRFGGIAATAQRLAVLAAQRNLETVDERLKAAIKASVGIDIAPVLSSAGPVMSAMAAATRDNIELIKSIPDQYFEKLGDAVGKSMERGLRFEDLAKEVERIGGVTESRAKLIARDQTSKMNSAFNRVRQSSLGISQYRWQTAGDERVRETHAEHDGKVFRWNDPPSDTGHPGEDINCRCVAIPYFNLDEEEAQLGIGDAYDPDQPRDERGRWTGSGSGEVHAEVSGNELGEHGSTVALRKAAMAYAGQHLVGKSFRNVHSGHEIKITRQGIKHALSRANPVELKLAPGLPKLLEHAEYRGSEPDRRGRQHIKAAHKYLATAMVGGERLSVGIVTHEKFDGHEHYDHFIVSHK